MFLEEFICGGCFGTGVPAKIAWLIRLIYNGIRVGIPIILVIVGMIGLGKAITQQKEDEIKKAQNLLVKQAIAAGLVFLMLSLVGLLFSIAANGDADKDDIWSCVNCILNVSSEREVQEYVVTFDSDGGSIVSEQTVVSGGTASKPQGRGPFRNDDVFKEWRFNGVTYDFSTPVTSNITLTAVYGKNVDIDLNYSRQYYDWPYAQVMFVYGDKYYDELSKLNYKFCSGNQRGWYYLVGNTKVKIDINTTVEAPVPATIYPECQ